MSYATTNHKISLFINKNSKGIFGKKRFFDEELKNIKVFLKNIDNLHIENDGKQKIVTFLKAVEVFQSKQAIATSKHASKLTA